eukprot:TRINITY_DN3874_c0_g2_i2.p1 TRINITY_DN3874_c0_g2~~TRINITY_DN3874_c0_g2_i2.p1  ORF type:complete len:240 (-),score=57.64 TRINITY_DN3874_c0_g2_i2:418-1041(-)
MHKTLVVLFAIFLVTTVRCNQASSSSESEDETSSNVFSEQEHGEDVMDFDKFNQVVQDAIARIGRAPMTSRPLRRGWADRQKRRLVDLWTRREWGKKTAERALLARNQPMKIWGRRWRRRRWRRRRWRRRRRGWRGWRRRRWNQDMIIHGGFSKKGRSSLDRLDGKKKMALWVETVQHRCPNAVDALRNCHALLKSYVGKGVGGIGG